MLAARESEASGWEVEERCACEDRATSKVRSARRCLRMHRDADKEVRTSSIGQGRRSMQDTVKDTSTSQHSARCDVKCRTLNLKDIK